MLVAGLLVAALAACGSQVSPEAVRQANALGGSGNVGGSLSTQSTGSAGASGTSGRGAAPKDRGGNSSAGAANPRIGQGLGLRGRGPTPSPCGGFKNQTGITNNTITVANVADITGPVPGVFKSAQQATRAFISYFNASHPAGICGRKLQLLALDSETSASGDQQAYQKACEQAFAAVGSMSAFDSGGAGTAQQCGLPDMRATAVTSARVACKTCFGAQGFRVHEVDNATPRFFRDRFTPASQHAALLYIDADAARTNAESFKTAWEKNGFKFIYTAAIDVAEFNYIPYVQKMQQLGVRCVQFVGPYQDTVRLAQAMKQQGFKPDCFVQDSTIYDQDFVKSGGSAVNGFWTYLNITPFTDTKNPEMVRYLEWLNQVAPGSSPTFIGVFAWSATRLFVERSLALGGKLTRSSLIASFRKVDNWTGNGIHAPQHVGPKNTGPCWSMYQLHNGHWVNESGPKYICEGLVHT